MFEMSHSCHEHRYVQLISFVDAVVVANAASGLHYSLNAILSRQTDCIVKRQEAVGSQD